MLRFPRQVPLVLETAASWHMTTTIVPPPSSLEGKRMEKSTLVIPVFPLWARTVPAAM